MAHSSMKSRKCKVVDKIKILMENIQTFQAHKKVNQLRGQSKVVKISLEMLSNSQVSRLVFTLKALMKNMHYHRLGKPLTSTPNTHAYNDQKDLLKVVMRLRTR